MNFKRIGRILVCLILVCSLLISISPIKAHATAAAFLPVAVPTAAPLVIGAILIGLGITYGVTSGAFDDLIDSCAAALSDLGDIVNDKINLYVYDNRSYVDPSIIRNVRGHLFSKSFLTEELDRSTSIVSGVSFSASSGTCTINNSCYGFLYYNGGSPSVILIPFDLYSASNLCTYDNGTSPTVRSVYTSSGFVYYVEIPTSGYWVSHMNLGVISNASSIGNAIQSYFAGEFEFSPKTVVTTELDVTLSGVVPSTTIFEEAYATWSDLSLNTSGDSGDEDMPAVIYPISVPESETNFSTITQEDVWSGGTMSVPGTGTDTGSGTISGTITLPGWVQDGINNLLQGLKDLLSGVLSLPAAIAKFIWDTLPAWLTEGVSNMVTGLRDILDSIKALPGAIAEALADVITGALTKAFAISDTFVATKVEALTLKYPYLDTFLALGVDLKAFFLGLGTTPPVIYINLGASEGSYNIGGQEVFMDLSWYSRYKPTMDAVIGGFIWLWLAWRIYLSIPGIISGASGVWGSITRHSERSMKNNSKENAE